MIYDLACNVAAMSDLNGVQMDRGTRQLQEMLHKAQVRLRIRRESGNTAARCCWLQPLCNPSGCVCEK